MPTRFAFLIVAAFVVLSQSAVAQTVPALLATISGTTQFRDVSVSPDGHYAAWTVALRNKDNTASGNSEIWILDLTQSGATPQKISAAGTPRREGSVAWSPTARSSRFSPMRGTQGNSSCMFRR